MATIRIEPAQDPRTGLYYIEIYHPADASQPVITTAPRYVSANAAETDTIAILAAGANNPRPADQK